MTSNPPNASPHDEARLMALRMADDVRAGRMSRDQWDLNVQQLMQTSQLRFVDYEAAKAVIEAS